MITLYRAFLVLMIVMSALMMPEAIALPRDAEYTIGPGFLPLIMLGAIIVCCALLLIFDLKRKSDAKVKKDAYLRLILYILATILLVLGMQYVGIALSVLVYLFCISFFVEKHDLVSSIKVSVITTVVIYLIFHTWLNVPMTICNFF